MATPFDACKARDIKGLYQKAEDGLITGFTGVALLWGIMAFQLNGLNADLLATKVGELLSANEYIAKLGGLTPTRLVYVTAILGGLVGGFGAMTGSYARMMLQQKPSETEEKLEVA